MSAAEEPVPPITAPLSWAEICEIHPDSWVCLVEIEHEADNSVTIRSARVIGHGKTRRESLHQIEAWWETYPVIGHFFTGKIKPASPRFPRVVMTDEIRELVRSRR